MSLKLTSRDLALMRWINSHGFVNIHHIARFFETTVSCAYTRVKALVDYRYLNHTRIFYGLPGIYRTTQSGVQLCASELPPLRHVQVATYQHDLSVVTMSVLLLKTLGGTFTTERQLRQEMGVSRFNHRIHVSDGLFNVNNKTIALEIELSKKTKSRRDSIIQHYMTQGDIYQVWYCCGSEAILRNVEKATMPIHFVKCFLLDDVLKNVNVVKAACHG